MTDLDDAAVAVQVAQAGVQGDEGDDNFVTYFPRYSLQHGTAPATPPQTRHGTRARRWVWDLGRAGLVAMGYCLSAKVGLAYVVQPEGLATVWPPSGFLLAVLVVSPQRTWAVILGGVLCSIPWPT